MTPIVRPATLQDAIDLAPRLRKADAEETFAACGLSPEAVLTTAVQHSVKAWAVEQDDVCHMLFGVAPFPYPECEHVGVPWMLASDHIEDFKFPFLRQSRKYINEMHDLYPMLMNYADNRNTVALEWLSWCGFEFTRVIPDFGYEKRPFIEFMRYRKHV